ncbi:sirohydrochlorin chelatase [Bacillus smithii]|uniref:sirohydrochlorin chelatase n=1 Tax=Bacillus smithii TaxID=1479 RepID=UPI002E2177F5|nr:sirohydrochlorin chelatase [Bacillus smithii]
MKAVLYICHGSRVKKGCEQAIEFVRQVQKEISIPIQEIAFLELARPTIKDAFLRCIEKGADEVYVIPILLFAAGHVKTDIPKILLQLQVSYPSVTILYGEPIGVHKSVSEILKNRIKETGVPIKDHAGVLLVARGSKDKDMQLDFNELARRFKQKTEYFYVKTSYLTGASPSFEEALEEMVNDSRLKQIFVLPYLLFTGLLMKGMEKKIRDLDTEKDVILCRYLGYDPLLKEAVQDRVKNALKMGGIHVSYYG